MSKQSRKRLFHTDTFVTEDERNIAVNLFGNAHSNPGEGTKKILNEFLQSLGEKYGYNWLDAQIAPNGEILLVKEYKSNDVKS